MAKQNLGMVTAYAYAVVGGYEGTEAEFEALLGNIATDLEEIENLTVIATTLPAGSAATASYDHGVLTLGIPKGDKGDTGEGATVAAGTTTTGAPGTNASVVNAGTAKDAVFNFTIPRGNTGNGIESIYLTGTSGAVKTYTILFTDGNTTTFDVTDGEVTNDALTAILADYAKTDGAYESMTVGNAEQLISSVYVTDEEPYQFRTSGGSADIGDREFDTLVGGSVAWNQLVRPNKPTFTRNGVTITNNGDGTFTFSGTANATGSDAICYTIQFQQSHKYLLLCKGASNDLHFYDGYGADGYDVGNGKIVHWNRASAGGYVYFDVTSGVTYNAKVAPMLIDLTQLFGSTIADYIYTLEQGQAGAGVAFFRKYFPKPYYPYDAGTIKSVEGVSAHKTVGFNAWDEEWEVGIYDYTNGNPIYVSNQIRSKNFIQVVPNTSYYIKCPKPVVIIGYDADKNYVRQLRYGSGDATFTTRTITGIDCYYIKFCTIDTAYGNTYNNDICINLSWDGERNGEYEPYVEHSYPLDSSLTLRGIPKIANGKLYYDGDTYRSDGLHTERYKLIDLGTLTYSIADSGHYGLSNALSDAKVPQTSTELADIICSVLTADTQQNVYDKVSDKTIALATNGTIRIYDTSITASSGTEFATKVSGIYLLYPLATPTTETADTFVNPQIVDDFGTEEYVTTSIVPVGHSTKYTNNLKAKLEMSPESPSGDGDYIVRQTSGTNEYVPLGSTTTISSIITRLEALENA